MHQHQNIKLGLELLTAHKAETQIQKMERF
jgi:hypothetical protein